ncbi:efflux RND transporter permease subunit [Desulfoluna spongiiphila]|uniref:SSD domain-containing protein n=1 Tax=Desulfoluna spongiiphila TaxID=419481 RepID=A0A1G5G9C7_9BACT|nr:MMPL family transporter [Desulfoluna spongiiphila]SCY48094.1 hypothetical protein SAMN05216233_11018 [Desulfoluna spongiiphila]
MNGLKRFLINAAIIHAKRVALLILAATLAAAAFFPRVVMDTDPENMLKTTEPARLFNDETKKNFTLSEIVIVGIVNEEDPDGVFNPETLSKIHTLTRFASTLRWPDASDPSKTHGVIAAEVVAPSLVDHMSQDAPGSLRFDWLMPEPPKTREAARSIRDKALSNPLIKGRMVSEDGRAVSLYLPLTEKLISYKVYTALREKIAELNTSPQGDVFHITGLPVAEGAVGVEMFTQMSTASPLAMVVILGLLALFFRKWELIILPMIIATVSIVITMGLMIGAGYPVHILSSMLPIFLMSIAMVDSVHVLSEFFDTYTPRAGRADTIRSVMETLFAPMLYTSLTTAAGFLSLTLAPIPPAKVFGGFLCIGVMVAWLLTVLFVPAYVMMIPERRLESFGHRHQSGQKVKGLARLLSALGRFTFAHAKVILAGFCLVVAISIWGITRIQVNDNYAKRFDTSHPIRQADTALNRHFSGTYTAYLVLSNTRDEVLNQQDIQELMRRLAHFADAHENPLVRSLATQMGPKLSALGHGGPSATELAEGIAQSIEKASSTADDAQYDAWLDIQTFLEVELQNHAIFKRPDLLAYVANLQAAMDAEPYIGKTESAADVVRKVNQELTTGKPEDFTLPDSLPKVAECYLQFQQSHRPNDLWHLVTPDYKNAIINLHFNCGDSMATRKAVEAVNAYTAIHPPPVPLSFKWAGLHYINRVLEIKLVGGFLRSFAGSFLMVLIMMAVLFRSPLWAMLCMVPLAITLPLIYGATGLMGKDYDLPIAVMSALSIGMAVDFAIHFLERSRKAVALTGSWESALPMVFGEPARAISRNVLVVAFGFLPLLVASLVPYKTTGAMLFAIMAASGLITLVVLPAILTVWENRFFPEKKPRLRRPGDDPLDPRFANAPGLRSSGRSHSQTGFARRQQERL